MKIEIKSWLSGAVLFSHDCENNTIKITVEAGVKASADLRYADLGYADLRSANLRYANLGSANLRYANLRSADLGSADLGYADLRSANLGSADLRSANLGSADLGYANLRSANLGDKENPIEDIKQIGPTGSRSDYTTCFRMKKSIVIKCGCFTGSLDEFAEKVSNDYGPKEKHGIEYGALIQYIKTIWCAEEKKPVARKRKAVRG